MKFDEVINQSNVFYNSNYEWEIYFCLRTVAFFIPSQKTVVYELVVSSYWGFVRKYLQNSLALLKLNTFPTEGNSLYLTLLCYPRSKNRPRCLMSNLLTLLLTINTHELIVICHDIYGVFLDLSNLVDELMYVLGRLEWNEMLSKTLYLLSHQWGKS